MNERPLFPRPVPQASLNRAIINYPGVPGSYSGLHGRDLLAKAAIVELCTQHGVSLDDFYGDDIEPPADLVREWGRRLGVFSLNLWFGGYFRGAESDEVRTLGDKWATTGVISCGGGLLAHRYGGEIIRQANIFIDEYIRSEGLKNPRRLELCSDPRSVNLNGLQTYGRRLLARDAEEERAWILALDFGHGDLKARVFNSDESRRLATRTLNFENSIEYPDRLQTALAIRRIISENSAEILTRCSRLGIRPSHVLISLAAYIHNGEILENHIGAFASLREIEADGEKLFSELIPGMERVRLFHDGQAAALGISGSEAVLIFGTAIGYGFAPEFQ